MAIKQRPDSPTNNFCVLNAVLPVSVEDSYAGTNTVTHKEGNLVIDIGTTGTALAVGTFIVPKSGKWYFEGVLSAASNVPNHWFIGFYNPIGFGLSWGASSGRNNGLVWLQNDGVYNLGSSVSTGNSYAVGEVIGVVYDADNGEIYFAKNGTWINSGDPSTNSNPAISGIDTDSDWFPSIGLDNNTLTGTWRINFGQDSTFNGNKNTPATVNGVTGPFAPSGNAAGTAGLFYYPPPAGAKALCSANLPEMTPTVDDDVPKDYFKAKIYSGTNSNQNIDIGFNPDFVWTKQKNGTQEHWFNSTVLGTNYTISINPQAAPASGTGNGVNNFSPTTTSYQISAQDGLNINGTNNLVSWSWKAGGFSSNFNINGSTYSSYNDIQSNHSTNFPSSTVGGTPAILIPNKISVNTISGFSCLTFIGTGSAAKIPHGLGSAPKFFISKRVTSYNTSHWDTWHVGLGATKAMILNGNGGEYVTDRFYDTAPDDLYYYVKTDGGVNGNGSTHVTFLWAEVEGYSKFGSYTGNGSATGDGPFVYTGFRPAFVMVKRITGTFPTTTDGLWTIVDSTRRLFNGGAPYTLYANNATAEYTGDANRIDLFSNGFKLADSNNNVNTTEEYIFMAFAEQPFNYANAR